MNTRNFLFLIIFTISIQCLGLANDFILPKSFQAEFTQEYKSEVSQKVISTQGILAYQNPGRLRFEIIRPKEQESLFVSNGTKAWFYTPPFDEREKGEVKERSPESLPFTSFFDLLLKFKNKNNEHYKVVNKDKIMEVQILPLWEKKIQIKKAQLVFLNKDHVISQLQALILDHSDAKQSKLLFKSFKPDMEVKKDYFEFSMPNAKIK